MTTLTRDDAATVGASRTVTGLLLALLAAVTFGLSGALARGLLDTGWTPGSVVLVRIGLAAAGLVIGGLSLGILGLVGLLPMTATTQDVTMAGAAVAWWVPLVLLGLVTAAIAYVSGIAASRRLGSRVASFVALTEVVMGVHWAWLLLDERPRPIQLVGGILIMAGVVAVKLGERSVPTTPELPA